MAKYDQARSHTHIFSITTVVKPTAEGVHLVLELPHQGKTDHAFEVY